MKALIGTLFALVLFTASASAGEVRQAGFVCNSVRATEAVTRAIFLDDIENRKRAVRLVSTPTDWCVPGFVRFSRPNSSQIGLGVVQNDLDESRRSILAMVEIAETLAPIPVLSVARTFLSEMPHPIVDLRQFKRENDRDGFYVNIAWIQ